jgi:uncharacterized membrane protein
MAVHSDFFFIGCAIVLGLVSGMRSMMAAAALSLSLSRRPELAPPISPVQWFTLPPLAVFLALVALGELVGDKLPRTPNRTALGPFLARVVMGAVTGAAFVQIGHVNAWLGAAAGGLGAVASTFGMFHARRFVGRITGINDPWIGAMEDLVAVALAVSVVASLAA